MKRPRFEPDAFAAKDAVLLNPGPSLAGYDDASIPRSLTRLAVEDAVEKCMATCAFWLVASRPAFDALRAAIPKTALTLKSDFEVEDPPIPLQVIETFEAVPEGAERPEGVFAGQGAPIVTALDVCRFLGFRRVFVFGMDLYRTKRRYYFDDRAARSLTEKRPQISHRLKQKIDGEEAFVTPHLRRTLRRLHQAQAAGAYDGVEIYCVASPHTQQEIFPSITLPAFQSIIHEDKEPVHAGAVAAAAAEGRGSHESTSDRGDIHD